MSCGKRDWTPEELGAFEQRIADRFLAKEIHCPIHLSGGNENQLIAIFTNVAPQDWVLSTHRSHYHALLHGISPDWVEAEILAGRSMHLNNPEHHFVTSAIVGGIAPIAVGIAMGLKREGDSARIWCFLGDMAARMGIIHEAMNYSLGNGLDNIVFIVEDNGLSGDTPTTLVWAPDHLFKRHIYRRFDSDGQDHTYKHYIYKRQWPHVGVGQWVTF